MEQQRDEEIVAANSKSSASDSGDAAADGTERDEGELIESAERAERADEAMEAGRQDLLNELWSPKVEIEQIVAAQRAIELGLIPHDGLAELQKAIEAAIPVAVENTEGGIVALLGDKSATPEQLMQRVIGAARGHQLLGVTPSGPVQEAMHAAGSRVDAATGSDVGSSITDTVLDQSSGMGDLRGFLGDMTGTGGADVTVGDEPGAGDGSASDGPLADPTDIPDTDPAPDEGGSASDGPLPENDDIGGDPTPTRPATPQIDMDAMMGGDPTGKGVESSGVTEDGRPYTDLEIGGGSVWRTYDDTNTWQIINPDGTTSAESEPAGEPQAATDDSTNPDSGTTDDDSAGAGDATDSEEEEDSEDEDDSEDDDSEDDDGDTATATPTEDDPGAVAPDPFGIAASASPLADLSERISIRYWDDKQPGGDEDDASGGGSIAPRGDGVTDPPQDEAGDAYARDINTWGGAGPEYGPDGPIVVDTSGPPPTGPSTGPLTMPAGAGDTAAASEGDPLLGMSASPGAGETAPVPPVAPEPAGSEPVAEVAPALLGDAAALESIASPAARTDSPFASEDLAQVIGADVPFSGESPAEPQGIEGVSPQGEEPPLHQGEG